jgi:formyl-CoA transferase
MGQRTLAENLEIFEREGITAAPIYDISQIAEDEHYRGREAVIEVADDELGTIAMHNVIPRLSSSPGRLRRPAPRLGEHTAEILGELGLGAHDLERLRDGGVI